MRRALVTVALSAVCLGVVATGAESKAPCTKAGCPIAGSFRGPKGVSLTVKKSGKLVLDAQSVQGAPNLGKGQCTGGTQGTFRFRINPVVTAPQWHFKGPRPRIGSSHTDKTTDRDGARAIKTTLAVHVTSYKHIKVHVTDKETAADQTCSAQATFSVSR
jgi:hypothetical protein